MTARLYYHGANKTVVIARDGRDIDRYPSAFTLVGTHIKGMLASLPASSPEAIRLRHLYHQHQPEKTACETDRN